MSGLVDWNREEKQAIADELAACRDAQAAIEQQLAAQREAGEALAAQKAQLAADLAAKQQALEAALQRCEAAEVSACGLRTPKHLHSPNGVYWSIVAVAYGIAIAHHMLLLSFKHVSLHADMFHAATRLQAQLPQIQVLADKLREAHEQLNVAEFNATEASIAAEALVATLQARAHPAYHSLERSARGT